MCGSRLVLSSFFHEIPSNTRSTGKPFSYFVWFVYFGGQNKTKQKSLLSALAGASALGFNLTEGFSI